MGDFADGLKGSLYTRTYLTEKAKEILLEMIEETLSRTCDIEFEEIFERTIMSMYFLKNKLDKDFSFNEPMSLDIATFLHHWVRDHRYYHRADEKDFDKAMQWVTNLWCRKYSISDFTLK